MLKFEYMRMDLEQMAQYAFPNKALSKYSGKELAIASLAILAVGGVLLSVIAAPNLGLLFKHFKADTRNERWRIYQRLKRLEKDGYIKKSGRYYAPTPKGELLLNKAQFAQSKKHPVQWDGKWHFVMFDLPAKHLRARTDLRHFLQNLGYRRYQNSVYIHKYQHQSLIEQFCGLYGIRDFVNFVTATHCDNEQWVRSIVK